MDIITDSDISDQRFYRAKHMLAYSAVLLWYVCLSACKTLSFTIGTFAYWPWLCLLQSAAVCKSCYEFLLGKPRGGQLSKM